MNIIKYANLNERDEVFDFLQEFSGYRDRITKIGTTKICLHPRIFSKEHRQKLSIIRTGMVYGSSLPTAKKANKPEVKIIQLVREKNLPVKYVGNGQLWIGGYNPDFISIKDNKLIELFGDYWHNRPGIKKKDKKRIKVYKNNGYAVAVIWEHELQNLDGVYNKLRNFVM